MNVHFKDPDCAAGTFHTVTPLTLAGHLIGRLKLTPAASLSHERAFAFFAYVKKPKSMLDAAVFCGVGFSKEKDFSIWPDPTRLRRATTPHLLHTNAPSICK